MCFSFSITLSFGEPITKAFEMIEKWLKESYCDGFREIYETRNEPAKFLFWSVTMMVMMAGTGYFIYGVVINYQKSPTATTYSTIPMTEMALPEILICYNGGLNGTSLMEANISKDLILALSGSFTLGMLNSNVVDKAQNELDNFLIRDKIDIIKFYHKFGYDCEDIVDIVYPAAKARELDNLACRNLSHIYSAYYSKCYLHVDNGIQHWPGINGGMRMYLKSPQDSVSVLYPDVALRSDRSQSFAVFIQKTFFILTEKQVLVPMNMKTEISLSTKRYIRLPESKTSCSSTMTASSDDCFNRCYGDVFYRYCGCYPFRSYNPEVDRLKKICNVFEEQSCRTYEPQANFDCQAGCIPMCDEYVYDMTISYASVGTSSLSVASLWIGYDTMQITKVLYQNLRLILLQQDIPLLFFRLKMYTLTQ